MARPLLLCWCFAPSVLTAAVIEPIDDFRVGVAVQKAPVVHERLSAPNGGPAKSIDWQDGKPVGIRIDALWVSGPARPIVHSGLAWTGGVTFATTDITPDSYDIGNGTAKNTRADDLKLHYRQYGGVAGLGWTSAPTDTAGGDFHWELFGVARGGVATAQSASPGIASTVARGTGPWWEAGIQGGVAIEDTDWVFGLNAGWMYGRSTVTVDYDNGYSGKLSLIRNGPEIGLTLGYRF